MTRLEMVETLREKAGVTYDEAREALENNNWDMLDALLSIKNRSGGHKQTRVEEDIDLDDGETGQTHLKELGASFGDKASKVVRFILWAIRKGEAVGVEVLYRDKLIGTISLTVIILLFLLSWFVPIILFVLMLAIGFRFRFSTNTLTGKVINSFGSKMKDEIEKEAEVEKEYEYASKYNKE